MFKNSRVHSNNVSVMCKYKLERFTEFVWYLRVFIFVENVRFFLLRNKMFGFPPMFVVDFVKKLKNIPSFSMHMRYAKCRMHRIDYTICNTSLNKGFGIGFRFNVLYFFVYNVSFHRIKYTKYYIIFNNIIQVYSHLYSYMI